MAKTAIITGSSRGIGAAIAKRLAKDGCNIVINDVSQEALDTAGAEVAEACRAFGVKVECYAADVSDYAQCEAMVKWVKEEFGSVDINMYCCTFLCIFYTNTVYHYSHYSSSQPLVICRRSQDFPKLFVYIYKTIFPICGAAIDFLRKIPYAKIRIDGR